LDYVAGPLWERLAQAFPLLQPCIAQMRFNRRCFLAIASDLVATPLSPRQRRSDDASADALTDGGGSSDAAPNARSGAGNARPMRCAAAAEHEAAVAAAAIAAAAAAARGGVRIGWPLGTMPEDVAVGEGGSGKGGADDDQEGGGDKGAEAGARAGSDQEEEEEDAAPPSPLPDRDPIAGLTVRTRRTNVAAAAAAAAAAVAAAGQCGPAPAGENRPASYSGAVNLALAKLPGVMVGGGGGRFSPSRAAGGASGGGDPGGMDVLAGSGELGVGQQLGDAGGGANS